MKLPLIFKKILLFTALCLIFFSFPSTILAQYDTSPEVQKDWSTITGTEYAPTDVEYQTGRNEPGFSANDLTTWYTHTSNLVWGEILVGPSVDLSETDPSVMQLRSSGAIYLAGNFVTQLVVKPPTSSVEYLADLGSRLKLATPAYAQDGSGYQGLTGVLEIWKAFRNMAYALLIIIFVVVGFMIMFRSKLNPQTVVNLQLALPKLIITLILITFSYAIAGLVLDLIYLTIYLVVNLTNTFQITSGFEASELVTGSFFTFLKSFNLKEITQIFGESLGGILTEIFEGSTSLIGQAASGGAILAVPLVRLILGGSILFSLFKLLFQLILAYINIILQVIFAPIFLLFNALPAANTFGSWLKNLVANAAAFPAVAIMIVIGSALIKSSSSSIPLGANASSDTLFAPPMLGAFDSNLGQSFITSIIGLGIILMLPKVVQMIQEALKAKPAVPAGQAIIEGLGGALAMPSAALKARREAIIRRKEAQWQAQQIGKEIHNP